MIRLFFILLVLHTSSSVSAQDIKQAEDSLVLLLKHARAASHDRELDERNKVFTEYLRKTLTEKGKEAYNHPFDSLGKIMCTLKSTDNEFRLFNWNMEKPTTERHTFYCFIMRYNERKDEYVLIELQNRSHIFSRPEQETTDEKKWFGALYYKIIPVKSGGKTIYTLLGWDGNNRLSNKKLIETMTFSGVQKVKFGHPIFKDEEGHLKKRVIFEYSEQAYMSLKLYPDKKAPRIVFDHLSPETEQVRGHYHFYKPDFSYDAYIFSNGKWVYEKDVDARNSGKSKLPYNDPE